MTNTYETAFPGNRYGYHDNPLLDAAMFYLWEAFEGLADDNATFYAYPDLNGYERREIPLCVAIDLFIGQLDNDQHPDNIIAALEGLHVKATD